MKNQKKKLSSAITAVNNALIDAEDKDLNGIETQGLKKALDILQTMDALKALA